MHFIPPPLSTFQSALPAGNETQLEDFLIHITTLKIPRWLKPQVIFFTVWFGLLILASTVVVCQKIRTKNFWLVRLLPTSSKGNLIVVSITTAFPLLHTLAAVLFLIASWFLVLHKPGSAFKYLCLVACVCLFCAGWSSTFAFWFSKASFRKVNSQASESSKLNLTNLVFIAIVLLSMATATTFSCLIGLNDADISSKFRQWKVQSYSAQSSAESQMAAALIWRGLAKSTFFLQLVLLVFSGLFLGLFTFALISGICLWRRLDDHLKNSVPLLEAERAFTNSVLSAIVPVNASLRHEGTRFIILNSSKLLVRSISISVVTRSILLSLLFGYFGVTLQSTLISNPTSLGTHVGIIIVAVGWTCSLTLLPCLRRICTQAFNKDLVRARNPTEKTAIQMDPLRSPTQRGFDFTGSDQELQMKRYSTPTSFNSQLLSESDVNKTDGKGSSPLSTTASDINKVDYGFKHETKVRNGSNYRARETQEVEEMKIEDGSSDIAFSFNSTSAPPSVRASVCSYQSPSKRQSAQSRGFQSHLHSQLGGGQTAISGQEHDIKAEAGDSEGDAQPRQHSRQTRSIEMLISAIRDDFSNPRPKWSPPENW